VWKPEVILQMSTGQYHPGLPAQHQRKRQMSLVEVEKSWAFILSVCKT
jgi:hypothetical protein